MRDIDIDEVFNQVPISDDEEELEIIAIDDDNESTFSSESEVIVSTRSDLTNTHTHDNMVFRIYIKSFAFSHSYL